MGDRQRSSPVDGCQEGDTCLEFARRRSSHEVDVVWRLRAGLGGRTKSIAATRTVDDAARIGLAVENTAERSNSDVIRNTLAIF